MRPITIFCLVWASAAFLCAFLATCSPRDTFDCTGDEDPGYACPTWGHK